VKFPISTGQAAQFLGTNEPRLAELVRRGKIVPEPAIFAGRRLWVRDHILQAARALGLLTPDLQQRVEGQEVPE
jgi:hypothetical protein